MGRMRREPDSHKGDNGTIVVIGGSDRMHGAPIFAALAAEAGGADLIHLALPAHHAEAAKAHGLNFQVHPFGGYDIDPSDVGDLLELLATADAAVIGPGLARDDDAQLAIRELIEGAQCPLVLDASALQSWTMDAAEGRIVVLTPHLGELERMGLAQEDVAAEAEERGIVIHVKGAVDHIALPDGTTRSVKGGNPGLTVGGTGDALAGLIGSLLAQSLEPGDACATASGCIKGAGDALERDFGFAYGTIRLIHEIPRMLRTSL